MLNYSSPDVPVIRHGSKEASKTFNRNTNRNILIEMTKIITFLIKTIRNLRTNIYSFVCVTKNIALTNEVVGRLRVGETRHISDRCVP